MRLADFILANLEPILADWEAFARTISPGVKMTPLALRDHAADILRATALDMASAQTPAQQRDKSEGRGDAGGRGDGVGVAAAAHAAGRVDSGFKLIEVVSEYRALRASVVRLWLGSNPPPRAGDLDDLTRFNESIDQSLTMAVVGYTRRVERSRQMFLAILGHDLRGPLNAMAMSAMALQQKSGLDAESAEMVTQISDSAEVMARMIADMLDFTVATLGGGMPLSPDPMDLKALCDQVVDEIRAAHPDRTVSFEAQGDLRGEWDAGRLRQVVANLLGNAIQHGTGPVDLSVHADGPEIVLAFRNGGTPIPPDVLPTIFDPMVRGKPGTPRKDRRSGSIGLGLYIAREIVVAHGGTVDVVSSAADGTAFTVRLLRRHPAAPDGPPPSAR